MRAARRSPRAAFHVLFRRTALREQEQKALQQERSRAHRLVTTEREGTRLVVVCGFARGGPSASCAYPPFPVCRPAGAFTVVAFRRREDDEGESDGSALP
ncbi:MAG: hypothetical protein BRD47_01260 [Bacteroidetes bacterium QS_8_68_28]|nr:MAG: hypothetical protein BRD47_01260 [Bacteroidetes bacterium QS_8_68_28]